MALLGQLPDELLLLVVGYLTHPSLSKLSRVNRRFHDLTLPSLYTTFAGPKAQQFLRTITKSPMRYEVAGHVKNVQWRAYMKNIIDPTGTRAKIKRCIPTSERQPINQAFRDLGLRIPSESSGPHLDACFANTLSPYENWYLEFFLFFVPDVEEIVVHDAWYWKSQTLWFTHLAINPERFKCLKTVVIHGPLRLTNIIQLLKIPTLRSLELHFVLHFCLPSDGQILWAEEPGPIELAPKSIALEHLAIKRSYVQTTYLGVLLDSIKGLKSFTYEHEKHKLSYPQELMLIVHYTHLVEALERHSNTLTCLRLHDKHDSWFKGLQHVLKVLRKLEELDIILPHNVEEAVMQTSDRPSQIDLTIWLEQYFPPCPLHTLKLRCGSSSSSSFSRSFQHHCEDTFCKQFASENALNSVPVLRALAKRGLRRVCVAFHSLEEYCWQSFQLTKGVYQSAGLDFEATDYND